MVLKIMNGGTMTKHELSNIPVELKSLYDDMKDIRITVLERESSIMELCSRKKQKNDKYHDKLKDLITCDVDQINDKNTKLKESVKSFTHFMYFTNNDFPIKIENKERRTFVVANLKDVPPKIYFDELGKAIVNKTALKLFYDHLMEQDISQVDWKNDRPETEFMEDLKTNSRDPELSFLVEFVNDKIDRPVVQVMSNDLCNDFMVYVRHTLRIDEYKTNSIKFGIKLKDYHIDGLQKKKTKKGTILTFEIRKCIEWFKRQGHMQYDDDDDNEPIEPLDSSIPQGLSDYLRDPKTKLTYKS
jgi:hypothetical protein